MTEQDLREIFLNSYYAIEIAPSLATAHQPMVSKEKWVKANSLLIDELGKEEWLEQLLSVLESGDPTTEKADW